MGKTWGRMSFERMGKLLIRVTSPSTWSSVHLENRGSWTWGAITFPTYGSQAGSQKSSWGYISSEPHTNQSASGYSSHTSFKPWAHPPVRHEGSTMTGWQVCLCQ